MKKVDVVVSLIPYTFHAIVIKSAIREKKNVVTTSYVSPAMLELEEEVKKAGMYGSRSTPFPLLLPVSFFGVLRTRKLIPSLVQ